MIQESHNKIYFDRMMASIGDKARVMEYLTPSGKVMDFGAGGGDLAETIRHTGREVVAVDGSAQAIKRINSLYPKIETVESMGNNLLHHFETESFTNIVCSSIFHEVYSYGDDEHEPYQLKNIMDMMDIFKKLLKPKGHLIIRDGVAPSNYYEKFFLKFKTPDGMKFLNEYVHKAPFHNPKEASFGKVHYDMLGDFTVEADMSSIMELIYTYTWGWDSLPRESQEFYGIMTLNDYKNSLANNGWKIPYAEEYLQPGYPKNLEHLIELFDSNGNPIAYPSSNMIIVAEKS